MKHSRGLQIFRDVRTPLMHLVGDHVKARGELVGRKHVPDHVWISMNAGLSVRVIISVNTDSISNAEAGFDPRVRLGIPKGTWEKLPERGIYECHRFSYEEIQGIKEVDFLPNESVFPERMILDRVHQSLLLEVFGAPYHGGMPGVHQIHSRRSGCPIPESFEGRDGALRFHFREERRMETLFFKFCGQ